MANGLHSDSMMLVGLGSTKQWKEQKTVIIIIIIIVVIIIIAQDGVRCRAVVNAVKKLLSRKT
jgi:hypothetical protein